jgi:hypothetical protein
MELDWAIRNSFVIYDHWDGNDEEREGSEK